MLPVMVAVLNIKILVPCQNYIYKQCRTRSDCDKHVVNSSTDNCHFICEQKDKV